MHALRRSVPILAVLALLTACDDSVTEPAVDAEQVSLEAINAVSSCTALGDAYYVCTNPDDVGSIDRHWETCGGECTWHFVTVGGVRYYHISCGFT